MPQRLLTTPPPFAFRIVPPAPLQQRVAAARIAGPAAVTALMVERLAGAGVDVTVTAADLRADGFTAREIDKLGPAAVARAGGVLARREAERTVGRAA